MHAKVAVPTESDSWKKGILFMLAGDAPFIWISSLVVMPTKSGIGVRFDIILIGKKLSMLDGKKALNIGSPGKKNKMKVTIDNALFLNKNANSIPNIM